MLQVLCLLYGLGSVKTLQLIELETVLNSVQASFQSMLISVRCISSSAAEMRLGPLWIFCTQQTSTALTLIACVSVGQQADGPTASAAASEASTAADALEQTAETPVEGRLQTVELQYLCYNWQP